MPAFSPDLIPIAKLLDRSRPQVVVVVGTGVAINATGCAHASWLGLLKHGIRHLVQTQFQPEWGNKLEASLDMAFSPFNLQSALQHANIVEQALNTPDEKAFAQWLESAFADFKTRNEEKAKAPLQVLRDLHEAGALLLTTNYDSLLSDITGVPPVTWEEHADFHRVMTRQKAGNLHIHGHWHLPSSIVLGRSSYDRVVGDAALQQLFRTLWATGLMTQTSDVSLSGAKDGETAACQTSSWHVMTKPGKSPLAPTSLRICKPSAMCRMMNCRSCFVQSHRRLAVGRSFGLMMIFRFSTCKERVTHFHRDRNTSMEWFLPLLPMPNC
jgi:hypothetical protein